MATAFYPQSIVLGNINGGNRYENGDVVDQNAINAPIEASAYAVQQAEKALNYAVGNSTGTFPALSAYPVGSIYISTSGVSPADRTVFGGGSWQLLTDKFLLGGGGKYSGGATGGVDKNEIKYGHLPPSTLVASPNNTGQAISISNVGLWETTSVPAGTYVGTEVQKRPILGIKDYPSPREALDNMPPYLVVYMWKRVK